MGDIDAEMLRALELDGQKLRDLTGEDHSPRSIPDRKAFDPGDPFDAISESVRIDVLNIVLRLGSVAIYRDLPPVRQFEAFVAGALTGVVAAAFAHVEPHTRDAAMDCIVNYLPQAREQAEDILLTEVPSGEE